MQVIVLNFQCLLEVGEGTAKLLCPTEDACEVVVSYGAIPITFLSQAHSLVEQFQTDLEVLLLKEAHGEDVTDDRSFTCRSHQLKVTKIGLSVSYNFEKDQYILTVSDRSP